MRETEPGGEVAGITEVAHRLKSPSQDDRPSLHWNCVRRYPEWVKFAPQEVGFRVRENLFPNASG